MTSKATSHALRPALPTIRRHVACGVWSMVRDMWHMVCGRMREAGDLWRVVHVVAIIPFSPTVFMSLVVDRYTQAQVSFLEECFMSSIKGGKRIRDKAAWKMCK